MTRKTKAEAEATREQLLDAAEEAFLENGVAGTSLEAIARRASLTRGAVYWHFRDKADLFEAMVRRVRPPLSELVEHLRTEHQGEPLSVVRNLCEYGLRRLADDPRHRRVSTILLHCCEHVGNADNAVTRQDKAAQEFIELMEQQFARAAEQGRLHPALTPQTAARALHAYMAGLFSQYLRDPAQFDLTGDAEPLVSAFFEGISR
ncbi:MAG: TetR family transcriptional regulator [Halofilum sp. (in: g-proteobacteria)]